MFVILVGELILTTFTLNILKIVKKNTRDPMYLLPRFPQWYLLFGKTVGQYFKQGVDSNTDSLVFYLYSSVLYRKATNLRAKSRKNHTDAFHWRTPLTLESGLCLLIVFFGEHLR